MPHGHSVADAHRWQAGGWLVLGVSIFALLTVVGQFPNTFSYPVAPSESTLPGLQRRVRSLLSWLKLELLGIVLLMETMMVWPGEFRRWQWLCALSLLGAVLFTTAWHIVRMGRDAKS